MGAGEQGPQGLVGQAIAGYQLKRMLGIGATGAVFLATRLDETPDIIEKTGSLPIERPPEVAMKLLILPWQLSPDERADFKARFLREAQTLKRMRHPHILSVLDYGDDPMTGFTYMLLPHLAGGTLGTYIASRQGTIPLDEIAAFLEQLAGALDYAHGEGIVHRDIKPANILLDERHTPYLADFSIVRLLAETTTKLTITGNIMGTPAYMSPEQVLGSAVGPTTDIYSLGMVIYELVAGKTAFDATTIVDLIRQQAEKTPPSPREARPDLPAPAEAAILRALAKEPAERFQTAEAFAQAFSKGLRGEWIAGLTRHAPGAQILNPSADTTQVSSPPTPTTQWPLGAAEPRHRRPLVMALIGSAVTLLLVACVLLTTGIATGKLAFGGAPHATPTIGKTPTPKSTAPKKATPTPPQSTSGSSNSGATSLPRTPVPTPKPTPKPTPTPTPKPAPTATATPTPTPRPTPHYYETAGSGGSGTYTNYTNAGGTLGRRVAAYQTIEVSCRLTGFKVSDGNTWWYRVKSSPWNNAYYASADNYYNNGQTSGSLAGTPWVDTKVPMC